MSIAGLRVVSIRGDFVPRAANRDFRVKKSSMPAGEIIKEMSPRGQLRPIFAELAKSDGCYIIVSLDDDPTANGRSVDRAKACDARAESPA